MRHFRSFRVYIAILLATLAHQDTFAQSGGAGAAATIVLGTMGVAVGATASVYYGSLFQELSDWKKKHTESTAVLDQQCGSDVEMRLLGNNRVNYIFVGIKNNATHSIALKPTDIRVIFENGRERIAAFPNPIEDIEVKPQWRILSFIPLPDKADFKGQDALEVQIPILSMLGKKECVIQLHADRDKTVPASPSTYQRRTVFDTSIGLGSSILRSTNLDRLGGQGFNFDVGIDVYPTTRHGFGLGMFIDTYGGGKAENLRSVSSASNPALTNMAGYLQYIYRHEIGRRWFGSYYVGPAVYSFEYHRTNSKDYHDRENSSMFALAQKATLDYVIGRIEFGYWRADYLIGLEIQNFLVPSGKIGEAEASGNSTSALVRFKIGH